MSDFAGEYDGIDDDDHADEYDITEEMLVDFLVEHQIEDAEELEEFSQMIHLLMMEPNIPVQVIN